MTERTLHVGGSRNAFHHRQTHGPEQEGGLLGEQGDLREHRGHVRAASAIAWPQRLRPERPGFCPCFK
jgi:hypothetical protein